MARFAWRGGRFGDDIDTGSGGAELHPDVAEKAAVLCARLARNHPLPDGNKRVAYLVLLEFLARNDVE